MTTGFTSKQVDQLLRPINPSRVLRDPRGNSHVSHQDVQAHLIRVLGFGNFDIDVVETELLYCEPRVGNNGRPTNRYDACYRALVRLTIKDSEGNVIQRIENGSTGEAQNQTRGTAYDLAYKSAISLALKRCAISLGSQFGLSLYNKGQLTDIVGGTLVRPPVSDEVDSSDTPDVQEGVEQQVSMGVDETFHGDPTAGGDEPAAPAQQSGQSEQEIIDALKDRIAKETDLDKLRGLWGEAKQFPPDVREQLQTAVSDRVNAVTKSKQGTA